MSNPLAAISDVCVKCIIVNERNTTRRCVSGKAFLCDNITVDSDSRVETTVVIKTNFGDPIGSLGTDINFTKVFGRT